MGEKMKNKANKVIVKQDEEQPIPAEILAQSIVDIGDAMKKLSQSRLSRKAVIVLVKDKTGIAKIDIHRVLDALDSLERDWLK